MKDWKILILLLAVSTIIQFCVISHLLSKVDFLQEQVYKIGNWHCRLEEQYYADHPTEKGGVTDKYVGGKEKLDFGTLTYGKEDREGH